jgi:hypothetical protein
MPVLLLHIANQDALKIDVDDIPNPTDAVVIGKNPRDKADKEVNWLEDGVQTVIFPWHRITFVEVLPSEESTEAFPLPFRND